MVIIPAIDIKDGQCVRLYQGDMDRETVYYESPVDAARQWVEQGAELLHVVDLNGAVEGHPVHKQEVAAICTGLDVPVELGGGLRSLESVEEAMEAGVERVVIGTAAYESQDFLRSLCKRFPGKIVVGIDARGERVAIRGWQKETSMDAVDLARRCERDGASRIIYTDISRDGTALGLNFDETSRLAHALKIPVIASGGVASLEDIRRLQDLEKDGVEGVIIGRALYSEAFSLREAIAVTRKKIVG
ncbi:MAG: 1-(5-phosphoribosyl)-5-[(5-phosphoribosylamino)methylideneamino]imidazole-4-carboxamide isomerase [Deltaproteobacteria bacterium]|nr:1-(5-phosphoribosyl)-5-[(5-phosphoribosylamino)methylideneamino]imidazole-4-carboxamide isomerase [Deltaproteobacteria bacterium]MCZ6563244.1 1-(5-phosphoribosyl)-5-[(5-phosphoribosylamino)methylideneamino]imidazole-4-carboxamide isomerase [Deltaproteobacteria bacterium]